jgi:hypothetical protein
MIKLNHYKGMTKMNTTQFVNRSIVTVTITLLLLLTGCMRYLTHNRDEVLLEGIDIDQTLKVAEQKMNERQGEIGTALPVWVIRDQKITPAQAQDISRLYFTHIITLKKKFDIWHLTWAISDIYRLGDDSVKVAMHDAYADATSRAKKLKGIADKMANGDKLYMGDAHGGGRAFAKKHVVVPGKKGYLQSYDDYVTANKH